MADVKPKILIVESVLCAHSVGYFRAILANEKFCEEYEVQFLYADFGVVETRMLEPLIDEFSGKFKAERIELFGKANGAGQLSGFAKIRQVLKKVQERQKETGAEDVAFLNADFLIRYLGFPIVSREFTSLKGLVSGVFFNSRCFREKSWKSRLLKILITRGISSGILKKVMFLDHGVVELVQKDIGPGQTLAPAVDPWSIPPEIDESMNEREGKTLLCFGVHSIRKGTLLAVKMFSEFPERFKNDKLLVAGPVRNDIREEFYQIVERIRQNGSDIEVIDRYFEDQESWSLFSRSDIVLCPYVNFHGSSNVIIRAAAVGLPVVGPDFGYLGEVIAQKEIGAIYQNHDEENLLEAIEQVKENLDRDFHFYEKPCRDYADFHREDRYGPSFISIKN